VTTKLLPREGEGERLDRFELIAELASGGMATVYLARLSGVAGFQRLVAIKRLHPHLARDPDFVEMFLDEARLAARIHHPNVVPIQEVGESERGYYLVMDYVEGDTLARLLSRAAQAGTQVPHGVVIRILLDVLAGLHAAHELRDDHGEPLAIVHRDVSPQNILVGTDGVARLVDFGVARAASRLSTTRSGQLKGKLAYMAPEQARGSGHIDRRADLFSCGIVLWEALAVKRLFKGDAEAETLNRVLYEPIASPRSVRPDVPVALEEVCMKALARDVDQRFATAQEFADALENAARGLACMGSVRDVATCIEQVVGVALAEQRDAVRAWLARSEPSHGATSRPRVGVESAVTRVDGTPSRPDPSARLRGSGGLRVDRHEVTAPAPHESSPALSPSGALEAAPDKVSSVSSAVLAVAAAERAGGADGAPRRRSWRAGSVFAALALAALAALGGVWRRGDATRAAGASPPPPPGSAVSVPASASPATDVPPPPTSALAASSTPAAPVASAPPPPQPAATSKPASRRTGAPRPAGGAPPSATPASPSPGPALPDDLSRNPYR